MHVPVANSRGQVAANFLPRSFAESRLNFYRRFPGDYLRDTQHLTVTEHGIYNLLLDHLYSTEKPIATIEDAFRISRCTNSRHRAYCKRVLSTFFHVDGLGIWHKRVQEELTYAESKSSAARASAEARWKHNADAMRTHSVGYATSDSRLQTPEDSKEESKPSADRELNGFELFWTAYPKKVGKPQARRAWLSKVRTDDSWPEVLKGLEAWKATVKWQTEPDFIPYPATFLNGMRWQDSPMENNSIPISKGQKQHDANVAAIAEGLRRRAGSLGLAGAVQPKLPA